MSKLKFIFECSDCNKQSKSWTVMERHLNSNPSHAQEGYGAVNVYPQDAFNTLMYGVKRVT